MPAKRLASAPVLRRRGRRPPGAGHRPHGSCPARSCNHAPSSGCTKGRRRHDATCRRRRPPSK
jgi:hypothetical protein